MCTGHVQDKEDSSEGVTEEEKSKTETKTEQSQGNLQQIFCLWHSIR